MKWGRLFIAITLACAVPRASAVEPGWPDGAGIRSGIRTLTNIGIARGPEGISVTFYGDGPLDYRSYSPDGTNLAIDVRNAISAITPAVREVESPSLRRISVEGRRAPEPLVHIILELRGARPFTVTDDESQIVVAWNDAATQSARDETETVEPEEPPAAPRERVAVAPREILPAPAVPTPPGITSPVAHRVSLDFTEVDVKDILRVISEASNINFVSGAEVTGKLTMRLMDVPWDLALEMVLMSNTPRLSKVRVSDNVYRITTGDNLLREEEEGLKQSEIQRRTTETARSLEPLVTRSFSLSYAKVAEVKPRVESFMSDRKKSDAFMQADERTNTLIVRDLSANLIEIEQIIRQLDTPTPAVQIEARIVTMTSTYAKAIGIQWGFDFVADQAHGNPTGLTFPNSIGIGGNVNDVTAGKNFMVNLPATDPRGGVGIALGHIANAFNIDVRLSAMETLGQLEILSNPKILVVQNQKAIINVGQQLPVPKTDAEGNRTVEFKDVGIKLEVTPQITIDRRVFLDVQVERSRKGDDVQTTEGQQFSIDTERAQTKVLLGDGETSVIGGLFQQTKTDNDQGIPWLSKIPFLGWLFKSKSVNDSKQELLIFLTPRIVEGS